MADLGAQIHVLVKGGWMMIPLFFSGFFALGIMIERVRTIRFKLATPTSLMSEILDLAKKGDWTSAQKKATGSLSPIIAIIGAGIAGVIDGASSSEELELIMQNSAEEWIPVLERRIETLDTVITAAPMMGLLGTITGMMDSFQVLSAKGINETGAITGGVAEALISTATGLAIALVCLVGYNYLNQRVKDLTFEMESAAGKLVEAYRSSLRSHK